MKCIINIGEISLCFNKYSTIINSYFPNVGNSFANEEKSRYYINICGECEYKGNYTLQYETQNFLGASYKVYFISKKKYMVSVGNIYGDHMFVISGNCYDVYSLNQTPSNDILWAIRLCRELILNFYLQRGFIPLHSSAVSINDFGVLSIGEKRAGKTTTLCTMINNGADILSNDLTLVGINSANELIAIGWPWKITIGNAIAEKMGIQTDELNPKVEVKPADFCKITGCKWKWSSKIGAILFPHLDFVNGFTWNLVDRIEAKNFIMSRGIEYNQLENIFTGQVYSIDFESVINEIVSRVPCYSVTGDIWANTSIIIKTIGKKYEHV